MLPGMSVPTICLYDILDTFTQVYVFIEMCLERAYGFSLCSAISLITDDNRLGGISHLRHITFIVDTASLKVGENCIIRSFITCTLLQV
jgi:hypothetical protein